MRTPISYNTPDMWRIFCLIIRTNCGISMVLMGYFAGQVITHP